MNSKSSSAYQVIVLDWLCGPGDTLAFQWGTFLFQAGRLHSYQDLLSLPGTRVLENSQMFAGPKHSTYTYARTSTQRNIYRIPLP